MPDYASILRRSISGLADPSPEMREAVYQRARAALARQLTAVDPPLSTREIESQHQELEDAVARLEAEFAPPEPEPAASAFGSQAGKDDFLYPAAEPAPAAPRSAAPVVADAVPPPPAAFDEDEEDFDEDEGRGLRLPLLVALACIVLVVVGAGAYVYAERSTLFGSGKPRDQVAAVESPATSPSPESAPAEPPKLSDRLTNGAEAPPPAPALSTADATPPAAVVTPPAPAAANNSPTSPEGLPLENLSSLQGDAASNGSAANLVEQRAIYYFQGAQGQPGQANDGTVTWAQITKDNRPAIQATLKIPQRNVTVTVTIYKNYDNALPASHLVEVQFFGALADSPIQRVPALVLKQTEQARGQPLAGAAVPVTNELFWIALSANNDDVNRNVQLLREGSWFDIPILFSDQTRALITFEKGVPGDKVFETVMASWTPS